VGKIDIEEILNNNKFKGDDNDDEDKK